MGERTWGDDARRCGEGGSILLGGQDRKEEDGGLVDPEDQETGAAGDRLTRDKLNWSLCEWQTEARLRASRRKDRQGSP